MLRNTNHIKRSQFCTSRFLVALASLALFIFGQASASWAEESSTALGEKHVIGATATIEEVKTDLLFKARIDTGATTSSLNAEDWVIEDEAEEMADNVGKQIRFRVKNHDGKSEWIESRIAEVGLVKTSEEEEHRYKVYVTLRWKDVKKKVLVTLNDRSHMKYPMLIGRNFLKGDFVVDVERKRKRSARKVQTDESTPNLQVPGQELQE